MSWEKSISGFRRTETRRGDTLQRIALREMGDASRWYDLVTLNDLRPPYLTDDPAAAGPQVLLTGQLLRLPATDAVPAGVVDPVSVFGQDLALPAGRLRATADGDLLTVTGVANLRQALVHCLETDPGELMFHPTYGCPIRQLIGKGGEATIDQLAAGFVDRSLRADPRIARTHDTSASLDGDTIQIDSTAVTVDGKQVPIGIGEG